MTRREFQRKAALFVMGCVLQIVGELPHVGAPQLEPLELFCDAWTDVSKTED